MKGIEFALWPGLRKSTTRFRLQAIMLQCICRRLLLLELIQNGVIEHSSVESFLKKVLVMNHQVSQLIRQPGMRSMKRDCEVQNPPWFPFVFFNFAHPSSKFAKPYSVRISTLGVEVDKPFNADTPSQSRNPDCI